MNENEMVLQKLDAGLLTITMNRPDRRNALNPDMTRGLVEAARRAAEDHEVRAVLLKGAGGTFCVGGDVKSMAEGRAPLPFEAKMANLRRGMEVSRILHEMPKPVVAQVDGAAAGAGLSIALSCDLRVASASCKITTAFAKVGLSGDYGGTYFLTQLLGSAKARELYLTSPVLTAQEAYNLGIVTKVVPDAEVEEAARELAMSLAQGPSVTHYLKAVKAAGTTDAAAVMKIMKETPINDMFARNGRIREDGRMVHDMYLFEVKKPSESKARWDYYKLLATVPGSEAFQPLEASRCPLVKK